MSSADKLITEITSFAIAYRGARSPSEILARAVRRAETLRKEMEEAGNRPTPKIEDESKDAAAAIAVLAGIALLAVPLLIEDVRRREVRAQARARTAKGDADPFMEQLDKLEKKINEEQ